METEKQKLKLPAGFLWGAATAAHQVEGNNRNDWTEWEKKNAERLAREAKEKWAPWQQEKFPEMFDPKNYISGRACDHYNRYAEDFDIAKSLGQNAHRFSIEWSRVEPSEGKFDEGEIEHYRKVIQAIKDRGMEPFVTLWHWTIPVWLAERGGCSEPDFAKYFTRYSGYVIEKLGDEIKFVVTLNEPTSVISNSFLEGIWPPQKKGIQPALKVFKVLATAHNASYQELKAARPELKIGLANILQFIEPHDRKNPLDRLVAKISNYFTNEKFYDLTAGRHDFLAVQYYFHKRIKFPFKAKNERKEITDMGWEIYPEGLYHILKNLQKYNLPIYITENGLADAQDTKREKFIRDHLFWVHKAIQEGADVRGYFYWSLLDNFEWDKGFWPRFGLVEVDYETLARKIRPSAREYARICKENAVAL